MNSHWIFFTSYDPLQEAEILNSNFHGLIIVSWFHGHRICEYIDLVLSLNRNLLHQARHIRSVTFNPGLILLLNCFDNMVTVCLGGKTNDELETQCAKFVKHHIPCSKLFDVQCFKLGFTSEFKLVIHIKL